MELRDLKITNKQTKIRPWTQVHFLCWKFYAKEYDICKEFSWLLLATSPMLLHDQV